MIDTEGKIGELQKAIDRTLLAVGQLKNRQYGKDVQKVQELRARLSDAEVIELPKFFGQLISGLELQREFMMTGLYVRSFEDAKAVIGQMYPVLSDRMERKDRLPAIDGIIVLCAEIEEKISDLV